MLDIKKLLIKILLHLRHLPNYYNPNGGMNNRPTTANIDSDDTGSVIQFLSTSSMTTGKPKYDGNILHFNWDNSGKWASQLAIGHGDGNIQFRTQSDGATWSPWYDVCKRPHEITANTNLNNLKGLHFIYYCSGSATVATLTNCPTSNAFTMVVDDGTFGYERTSGNYIYLIQTVVDYQGSVWKRQIDTSDGGSTWTYRNWKRYIHSGLVANDLATETDGYVLAAKQGKVLKTTVDGKVSKSGDTMTGTLTVDKSGATDTALIRLKSSACDLGIYANGTNSTPPLMGLYDRTNSRWIVYYNPATDKVFIRGNEVKAGAYRTVASNLSTSSEGSSVLDAYQGKVLNDKFSNYVTTSSMARSTASLAADTSAHRYNSIGFEKYGKVVRVQVGILYNLPAATDTVIGTAPSGYRPAMTAQSTVMSGTTKNAIRISIATDGTMKAYNYGTAVTGNVNMQANITYLTS